VIEPLVVVVMRSCIAPMSVAKRRLIAYGPLGIRPNSADTSEPACVKRKDVVDEEQHVLALVAEMLGDREAGEADAGAGARRLVHLAVDQRAFEPSPPPFLLTPDSMNS